MRVKQLVVNNPARKRGNEAYSLSVDAAPPREKNEDKEWKVRRQAGARLSCAGKGYTMEMKDGNEEQCDLMMWVMANDGVIGKARQGRAGNQPQAHSDAKKPRFLGSSLPSNWPWMLVAPPSSLARTALLAAWVPGAPPEPPRAPYPPAIDSSNVPSWPPREYSWTALVELAYGCDCNGPVLP